MIVAVDVHYLDDDSARAAAVVFSDWPDEEPQHTESALVATPAEYVSGELYRRELPCILPLIQHLRARFDLDSVIVDAYVDLPEGPGLGRHLHDVLAGRLEVIGVAKTLYKGAPAREVLRGHSTRPLYVSATGDLDAACAGIAAMAGDTRIPHLLKKTDHLARGLDSTATVS